MELDHLTHNTFWYYRVGKRCNLLDHIYCIEHNTSYPSADSMKEEHPEPEYSITKTIKHVAGRRK